MFCIGLLGSCIAPYISPSQHWIFAIWGMSFLFWFFSTTFFCVIWLFIEKKYALLSLAIMFVGTPNLLKIFAFNTIDENSKTDLSIMSYNVELFKLYDNKNGEKHKQKIFNFISSNQVDIYCFQEYFHNQEMNYFETTTKLKEILPNYHFYFVKGLVQSNGNEFGTAIWSKYPIINKGGIVIDSTKFKSNIISYIDIKPQNDTIRIYNVHLASNHLNKNELDSIIGENEQKMNFIKKWVRKLKNGYQRREKQLTILNKNLEKCNYKKIIIGDFNDVPNSYTYQQMKANYLDAFLESGNGIGTTYTGRLPWLRIDYAFYSKGIKSTYFKVESIKSTDHYPIICKFKFE